MNRHEGLFSFWEVFKSGRTPHLLSKHWLREQRGKSCSRSRAHNLKEGNQRQYGPCRKRLWLMAYLSFLILRDLCTAPYTVQTHNGIKDFHYSKGININRFSQPDGVKKRGWAATSTFFPFIPRVEEENSHFINSLTPTKPAFCTFVTTIVDFVQDERFYDFYGLLSVNM